jgi:membrane fusion protein (multidrug efflux system)
LIYIIAAHHYLSGAMIKRFVIIGLIFGILIGGLAFFHFVFLPNMIRQAISGSPQPPETISAEPVRLEHWPPYVQAIGTVTAVNGIDVAAKVAGIVRKFHFESGSEVQAGARLVELDDDAEQADLRNLEASLRNAELELKRQQELASKGYSPRKELETARARRDELVAQIDRVRTTIGDKTIVAPWAGRLGIRKVDVGAYVEAGKPLVWLQTVDPLYVDFTIPEQEYAKVKEGQPIEATFSAYPEEVFKGVVEAIDARVDASTRSFSVRATLPNPQRKIAAGMFANVQVVVGEPQAVLTVPVTAITYSLYGDSVYVVRPKKAQGGGSGPSVAEPGKTGEPPLEAERRFVKLGELREGRVAVAEGVKEGELVVNAGQLKLRPGSHVRVDNTVQLQQTGDIKIE